MSKCDRSEPRSAPEGQHSYAGIFRRVRWVESSNPSLDEGGLGWASRTQPTLRRPLEPLRRPCYAGRRYMFTYVNIKAYDSIRKRIVAGHLRPGDRVSEYAEAKALGVSRGPVREAVRQLVSEGLVEKLPGIGSFVRGP